MKGFCSCCSVSFPQCHQSSEGNAVLPFLLQMKASVPERDGGGGGGCQWGSTPLLSDRFPITRPALWRASAPEGPHEGLPLEMQSQGSTLPHSPHSFSTSSSPTPGESFSWLRLRPGKHGLVPRAFSPQASLILRLPLADDLVTSVF